MNLGPPKSALPSATARALRYKAMCSIACWVGAGLFHWAETPMGYRNSQGRAGLVACGPPHGHVLVAALPLDLARLERGCLPSPGS